MMNLRRSTTLLFVLFVVAAFGCQPSSPTSGSEPARAPEQGASNVENPATKTPAEDEHEHKHEKRDNNSAGDVLLTTESVGQPISDEVELVEATALLANPDQYSGRTVKVTGTVKGFCHHRRAWFAIDVPGANPPYLRILTAPDFLVPPGIMNAEATAAGVVEVQETPGSRVTHYEKTHRLGQGKAEGPGRAKRVILRATGAVFSPAT